MTDEHIQREIDHASFRIAYHDAALRRAAEQRAREKRHPEYMRAAEAADRWIHDVSRRAGRRIELHPEAERLQRHAVDLAAEDPAVRLEWLQAEAQSTRLVGQCNALAFPNAKVAVCPPITSVRSYVVVLHEVGHNRDRSSYGKLAREVFAWRWAREHALVWDEEAQNCMVDSLRSYLVNTELKDVLGVLEVERLISPTEYKRELMGRRGAQVNEARYQEVVRRVLGGDDDACAQRDRLDGLEGIVASREATIKRLLGMIDSHKKLDQMKDGIIAAQREQVAGLVSIARSLSHLAGINDLRMLEQFTRLERVQTRHGTRNA